MLKILPTMFNRFNFLPFSKHKAHRKVIIFVDLNTHSLWEFLFPIIKVILKKEPNWIKLNLPQWLIFIFNETVTLTMIKSNKQFTIKWGILIKALAQFKVNFKLVPQKWRQNDFRLGFLYPSQSCTHTRTCVCVCVCRCICLAISTIILWC